MPLSEKEELELLTLERERAGVRDAGPSRPAAPQAPKKPNFSEFVAQDKNLGWAAEVPRTMLQNTLAQVASGYAGAAGTVLPGAPGQGARWQQATEGALAHNPDTPYARLALRAIGLPYEYLVEKPSNFIGGKIAEAGAPATGAVFTGAAQAAPMALGLRSFKYAPSDVVKLSREKGYKLTPTEADAGVVAKVAEGLSGEEKLSKGIARDNASKAARNLANEIGIPKDLPVTRETIAEARREAHKPYEEARTLGQIPTSVQYAKALDAITAPYANAAKSFPKSKGGVAQTIIEEVNAMRVPSFDASAAIDKINTLREQANKEYRSGDPALGKAYKDISRALEGQLVEHVQTLGQNKPALLAPHRGLVERMKKARETIAKSYEMDKALDKDGAINPQKYAQMEKQGKKLSGAAADVAKLAEDAPRSFRRDTGGNVSFPTWADMILAAKEAASNAPEFLLTAGARPAVRGILGSGPYQALQGSPIPGAVGYSAPFASTMAEIARRAAEENAREDARK